MDISTAHLLDSLGWAVAHSLWQGVIAAFVVYMFRSLTKDSQAGLRCGFELLTLGACFLAFVFTFASNLISQSGTTAAMPTFVDLMRAPALLEPQTIGATEGASFTSSTFKQYTPLLGVFWCFGFLLLATRYTFGFVLTHRLRTRGLSPAPARWNDRFETLVLNAGIFRKVALHVSERVSGPVTLGFFKPVVLVPASFFSGLPAEQIEAILLHEIAHIRRHDYMINLFQTAIKTVLFFHPAIHYISNRIDEDREKACDDFAVNYTRDPQSLAKGLATLRLHLSPPDFAMAASKKNTPLIQRLTRLTSDQEKRRRPGQLATSITAVILAASLYTTTQVQFANAHPPEITETKSDLHVSASKKNYQFSTIWHKDRKIVVKTANTGSRWVYFKNSWFNIDKNPKILDAVPEIPEAPKMPKPENFSSYMKFEKSIEQYRVSLDYYIYALEKSDCGKCTKDKLHWAKKQKAMTSDPHPDFQQDLLWKETAIPTPKPVAVPMPKAKPRPPQPAATPEPNPQPEPAPMPRPIPVAQEAELAGAPANTFYLNGVKHSPSDWEDRVEERLESLEDNFEANMDRVEDRFERALEKFEDASEKFSEDPEMLKGYFKQAQADFATAVIDTNEKRAELKFEFNHNIEKIIERDIKHHVDREVKVALRETQRAMEDAEREIKLAHKEAERERKLAMREAERERKQAMREAERARKEAFRLEREARDVHDHRQNHPVSDVYKDAMLAQLGNDGIIPHGSTKAVVEYRSGKMFVNGQSISKSVANEYCSLNGAFDIPKTDNMRIEIQPDRLTITNYKN